uniref:Uncharacterized protein n=1 Tax=Candidozyma auris TaxID=498019 RepID=A0A0L0NZC9_CANAR
MGIRISKESFSENATCLFMFAAVCCFLAGLLLGSLVKISKEIPGVFKTYQKLAHVVLPLD